MVVHRHTQSQASLDAPGISFEKLCVVCVVVVVVVVVVAANQILTHAKQALPGELMSCAPCVLRQNLK